MNWTTGQISIFSNPTHKRLCGRVLWLWLVGIAWAPNSASAGGQISRLAYGDHLVSDEKAGDDDVVFDEKTGDDDSIFETYAATLDPGPEFTITTLKDDTDRDQHREPLPEYDPPPKSKPRHERMIPPDSTYHRYLGPEATYESYFIHYLTAVDLNNHPLPANPVDFLVSGGVFSNRDEFEEAISCLRTISISPDKLKYLHPRELEGLMSALKIPQDWASGIPDLPHETVARYQDLYERVFLHLTASTWLIARIHACIRGEFSCEALNLHHIGSLSELLFKQLQLSTAKLWQFCKHLQTIAKKWEIRSSSDLDHYQANEIGREILEFQLGKLSHEGLEPLIKLIDLLLSQDFSNSGYRHLAKPDSPAFKKLAEYRNALWDSP